MRTVSAFGLTCFGLTLGLLFAPGCSHKSGSSVSAKPTVSYKLELERLAPENAAFVLSTTRLDQIRKVASKNVWAQVFGRETAWDIANAIRFMDEWFVEEEVDPFVGLSKINGPAVLFVQPHQTQQVVSVGLVVRPDTDEPGTSELWKWIEAAGSLDWTVSTHTIEGIDVRVLVDGKAFAFFNVEGYEAWVYSTQAENITEAVAGIIQRVLDSGAQGITANAHHKTYRKQRSKNSLLSGFFHFRPLWQEALGRGPSEFKATIAALQLEELAWAGLDFTLGADEYAQVSVYTEIPSGSMVDGILQCAGSLPTELLGVLPAENYMVGLLRFDFATALNALRTDWSARTPLIWNEFQKGIDGFEEEVGLQLEEDVFGLWKGSAAFSLVPIPWHTPERLRGRIDPFEFWARQQSPVVALDVRDVDVVETKMRTLGTAQIGELPPPFPIDEHSVQPLDQPQRSHQPNFAIFDKHGSEARLVFATHFASTQRVIERVDENVTKRNDALGLLSEAFSRNESKFLAIGIENATLTDHLVTWMRFVSADARDFWKYVRWPSSYSLQHQFKGATVLSAEYAKRILKVTVEAR